MQGMRVLDFFDGFTLQCGQCQSRRVGFFHTSSKLRFSHSKSLRDISDAMEDELEWMKDGGSDQETLCILYYGCTLNRKTETAVLLFGLSDSVCSFSPCRKRSHHCHLRFFRCCPHHLCSRLMRMEIWSFTILKPTVAWYLQ